MQRKYNSRNVSVANMLRNNMTKEEKHLWYDFLRNYPVPFSRQKILGRYIADFYCAKAKLVIELDGAQHEMPTIVAADDERTNFLKGYDLTVIRVPNQAINRNFREVCVYIDRIVKQMVEISKKEL